MKISRIQEQISKIMTHPLFRGSLVMVIGTNIFNFGQFIYHFMAGRFLGKVYYGDVAAIISIMGLVAIVQVSMGLAIVKFVAGLKDKEQITNFTKWILWWALWIGVGLATITLAITPLLVSFLNISEPVALWFLGPTLLFFVLASAGRAILQGLLKFTSYVVSFLVEMVVKLSFAFIFLVPLGYKVAGAIGSIFAGIILGFLVVRISLAHYLSGKRGPKPDVSPLLKYSFSVFVQGLALTSMYSTDLILVKHFFSQEQAGIYASLAVLGRIAFFGASPITHVMFPIVAKRYSNGMTYHNIFFLSVLFVGAISTSVVLLYIFLPKIFVGFLYGPEFIEGAPMLWWFGLFMSLLAMAMLFTQFYLSIGKTKIVWFFVAAALMQIFLIWFIHPTLLTVIQLSIVSAALLVLALIIYFPYHHKL